MHNPERACMRVYTHTHTHPHTHILQSTVWDWQLRTGFWCYVSIHIRPTEDMRVSWRGAGQRYALLTHGTRRRVQIHRGPCTFEGYKVSLCAILNQCKCVPHEQIECRDRRVRVSRTGHNLQLIEDQIHPLFVYIKCTSFWGSMRRLHATQHMLRRNTTINVGSLYEPKRHLSSTSGLWYVLVA